MLLTRSLQSHEHLQPIASAHRRQGRHDRNGGGSGTAFGHNGNSRFRSRQVTRNSVCYHCGVADFRRKSLGPVVFPMLLRPRTHGRGCFVPCGICLTEDSRTTQREMGSRTDDYRLHGGGFAVGRHCRPVLESITILVQNQTRPGIGVYRPLPSVASARSVQNPSHSNPKSKMNEPSTILILDGNSQIRFHKTMETEAFTKINRARNCAQCLSYLYCRAATTVA
jgi:hypothetical protein